MGITSSVGWRSRGGVPSRSGRAGRRSGTRRGSQLAELRADQVPPLPTIFMDIRTVHGGTSRGRSTQAGTSWSGAIDRCHVLTEYRAPQCHIAPASWGRPATHRPAPALGAERSFGTFPLCRRVSTASAVRPTDPPGGARGPSCSHGPAAGARGTEPTRVLTARHRSRRRPGVDPHAAARGRHATAQWRPSARGGSRGARGRGRVGNSAVAAGAPLWLRMCGCRNLPAGCCRWSALA
jgi:hypothetical protein